MTGSKLLFIAGIVAGALIGIFAFTGTTLNSGKGILWAVFLGVWCVIVSLAWTLKEPRQ